MKNNTYILKMKEMSENEIGTVNDAIYKKILIDFQSIPNMTLEQFAKHCNVSKPTIIKFLKSVNISGYAELKYIIRNELDESININREYAISKKYSDDSLFQNKYVELVNLYANNILKELENNNTAITELVDKINDSHNIYIFGFNLAFWSSKTFMQKILWSSDKRVILEHDINIIEMYTTQMPSNSVVIMISLSGKNPYMKEITTWLKPNVYSFGLLGTKSNTFNLVSNYSIIPQVEKELWDQYSIRSMYIAMFFDMLFTKLKK